MTFSPADNATAGAAKDPLHGVTLEQLLRSF